MVEQTAMNELLVWVRKTLPMDLDYPKMIEDKIESLIPKEKEQIGNAWVDGYKNYKEVLNHSRLEQYYNETYGKE